MTRRLKCRIDPEQSPYTCVLPEHKPVRREREMIDLLAVEEPKPKTRTTPRYGRFRTRQRSTSCSNACGAGGARGAPVRLGVITIHAPFTTEVECKMASVRADLFLHSSSAEIVARAANPYHAARTRGVFAAGHRLAQAKLSRNSNQIVRGRIRRFESNMPSQAVQSSPSKM
jgi:hypothetical protein